MSRQRKGAEVFAIERALERAEELRDLHEVRRLCEPATISELIDEEVDDGFAGIGAIPLEATGFE